IENLRKSLAIRSGPRRHITGRMNEAETYYRLQWSNVRLYDFLLAAGITAHKSLTIGKLEIPDEYFFHFLRGAFDGDGCFYSYFDRRWKSSFMFYLTFASGSHEHILWLQESISRLAGARGHITKAGRERGIYNLRFAKKESLIILPYLYPKDQHPCLSR